MVAEVIIWQPENPIPYLVIYTDANILTASVCSVCKLLRDI